MNDVDKKYMYALIGYLIGSFFGVSAVLGMFGGVRASNGK